MPDESDFTCIVRISDTYTDQPRGQVERDVWARLRYTDGDAGFSPELSVRGTYVGLVSQSKKLVGEVSGDLSGKRGVEVLDALYHQAIDGAEQENEQFVRQAEITFDPLRTPELECVCCGLETGQHEVNQR